MNMTETNKYWEISDYLMKKINSKELMIGEKLPSEMELSDRFKVNRYTVRQAMSKLVNLELVEAMQGKGYFVTPKPSEVLYSISKKSQFSRRMRKLGKEHYLEMLEWEYTNPSESGAVHLKIHPDHLIYRLNVRRYVENKVLSYSTTALRADFLPDLNKHLPELQSLYSLLETEYNLVPSRQYSIMQARLPLSDGAKHLQISLEIPLMVMESVTNHPCGMPLEYNYTRIRGDMNKCYVQLADVQNMIVE